MYFTQIFIRSRYQEPNPEVTRCIASDDINEKELEELYDKIDAEIAKHPPSEEELQREIDRMNEKAPEE